VKALPVTTIADVVSGRMNDQALSLGSSVSAHGFTVDSRELKPGHVFVAARGERVDGHQFAQSAVRDGAVVVLSEYDIPDVPCIIVDDSVRALGIFASWYRREVLTCTVIGITGSSGKTTTKDLIAQVLDGQVVAAPGSFNTEFGVPLTVLDAEPETDYLVLEMGMRGLGHIRYLADLVDPDIAVVINVGLAHVGVLDGPADIAQAKGELVEGLQPGAVAALNAEDPQVVAMAERTQAEIMWFGGSEHESIRALDVQVDPEGRAGFDLSVPGEPRVSVQLSMHGEHFVSSALAAAAVAHRCGVPAAVVADRLSHAQPKSQWRMEVRRTASGVTVINDAYNANPESMRAALKTLRSMASQGRTWAVLGEMRELGEFSVPEHDAIGRLAVRLDISRLVCVGPATKVMHLGASNEGSWGDESTWVPDVDSAVQLLEAQLKPNDVVLIKASRAVGLEKVAFHLLSDRDLGNHEETP